MPPRRLVALIIVVIVLSAVYFVGKRNFVPCYTETIADYGDRPAVVTRTEADCSP